MGRGFRRYRRPLAIAGIAALIMVVDQATKQWALSSLIEGFNLADIAIVAGATAAILAIPRDTSGAKAIL